MSSSGAFGELNLWLNLHQKTNPPSSHLQTVKMTIVYPLCPTDAPPPPSLRPMPRPHHPSPYRCPAPSLHLCSAPQSLMFMLERCRWCSPPSFTRSYDVTHVWWCHRWAGGVASRCCKKVRDGVWCNGESDIWLAEEDNKELSYKTLICLCVCLFDFFYSITLVTLQWHVVFTFNFNNGVHLISDSFRLQGNTNTSGVTWLHWTGRCL